MTYRKLKTIPKDKQLVIFDFYDTLVYPDHEAEEEKLRKGSRQLISQLRKEDKKTAISSDGYEDIIQTYLEHFEIEELFDGVYGADHIFFKNLKPIKDLEKVVEELDCNKDEAVFIGDDAGRADYRNWTDSKSAKHFGIDFILVSDGTTCPNYDMTRLYELAREE